MVRSFEEIDSSTYYFNDYFRDGQELKLYLHFHSCYYDSDVDGDCEVCGLSTVTDGSILSSPSSDISPDSADSMSLVLNRKSPSASLRSQISPADFLELRHPVKRLNSDESLTRSLTPYSGEYVLNWNSMLNPISPLIPIYSPKPSKMFGMGASDDEEDTRTHDTSIPKLEDHEKSQSLSRSKSSTFTSSTLSSRSPIPSTSSSSSFSSTDSSKLRKKMKKLEDYSDLTNTLTDKHTDSDLIREPPIGGNIVEVNMDSLISQLTPLAPVMTLKTPNVEYYRITPTVSVSSDASNSKDGRSYSTDSENWPELVDNFKDSPSKSASTRSTTEYWPDMVDNHRKSTSRSSSPDSSTENWPEMVDYAKSSTSKSLTHDVSTDYDADVISNAMKVRGRSSSSGTGTDKSDTSGGDSSTEIYLEMVENMREPRYGDSPERPGTIKLGRRSSTSVSPSDAKTTSVSSSDDKTTNVSTSDDRSTYISPSDNKTTVPITSTTASSSEHWLEMIENAHENRFDSVGESSTPSYANIIKPRDSTTDYTVRTDDSRHRYTTSETSTELLLELIGKSDGSMNSSDSYPLYLIDKHDSASSKSGSPSSIKRITERYIGKNAETDSSSDHGDNTDGDLIGVRDGKIHSPEYNKWRVSFDEDNIAALANDEPVKSTPEPAKVGKDKKKKPSRFKKFKKKLSHTFSTKELTFGFDYERASSLEPQLSDGDTELEGYDDVLYPLELSPKPRHLPKYYGSMPALKYTPSLSSLNEDADPREQVSTQPFGRRMRSPKPSSIEDLRQNYLKRRSLGDPSKNNYMGPRSPYGGRRSVSLSNISSNRDSAWWSVDPISSDNGSLPRTRNTTNLLPHKTGFDAPYVRVPGKKYIRPYRSIESIHRKSNENFSFVPHETGFDGAHNKRHASVSPRPIRLTRYSNDNLIAGTGLRESSISPVPKSFRIREDKRYYSQPNLELHSGSGSTPMITRQSPSPKTGRKFKKATSLGMLDLMPYETGFGVNIRKVSPQTSIIDIPNKKELSRDFFNALPHGVEYVSHPSAQSDRPSHQSSSSSRRSSGSLDAIPHETDFVSQPSRDEDTPAHKNLVNQSRSIGSLNVMPYETGFVSQPSRDEDTPAHKNLVNQSRSIGSLNVMPYETGFVSQPSRDEDTLAHKSRVNQSRSIGSLNVMPHETGFMSQPSRDEDTPVHRNRVNHARSIGSLNLMPHETGFVSQPSRDEEETGYRGRSLISPGNAPLDSLLLTPHETGFGVSPTKSFADDIVAPTSPALNRTQSRLNRSVGYKPRRSSRELVEHETSLYNLQSSNMRRDSYLDNSNIDIFNLIKSQNFEESPQSQSKSSVFSDYNNPVSPLYSGISDREFGRRVHRTLSNDGSPSPLPEYHPNRPASAVPTSGNSYLNLGKSILNLFHA